MRREHAHFRNPMDYASVKQRLVNYQPDFAYHIATVAAGHQGASTVDRLAQEIRAVLPGVVTSLADRVERENENKVLTKVQRDLRGIAESEGWFEALEGVNAEHFAWVEAHRKEVHGEAR